MVLNCGCHHRFDYILINKIVDNCKKMKQLGRKIRKKNFMITDLVQQE